MDNCDIVKPERPLRSYDEVGGRGESAIGKWLREHGIVTRYDPRTNCVYHITDKATFQARLDGAPW